MYNREIIIYPETAYKDYSGEELERKTKDWLNALGDDYKKAEECEAVVMRINSFLNMRPVRWIEVMNAVKGEQFSRLIQLSSLHVNAKRMLGISEQEAQLGLPLSCDECRSLEDLDRLYTEIMFMLRRLEFGYSDEELCRVIAMGSISFACIGQIIFSGKITEKIKVCLKTADIYIRYGKRKEAVYLLFFMAEFLKEEEEAIFEFCCFLLENKEISYGNEMLRKISKRTPQVEELQAILEGKLKT